MRRLSAALILTFLLQVPRTCSGSISGAESGAFLNLTPYGQPEDRGARPAEGELLAVRFDLPFPVPFEITKVSFQSFTSSGAPARFESVSLCELDPAVGLVRLATPIVKVEPLVGSADGWNDVPVHVMVHEPGRIMFLCFEFPSGLSLEDQPMLRWDILRTERGEFGTSYALGRFGRPLGTFSGNFVASMRCDFEDQDQLPLEPAEGLGASLTQGGIDFYFTPSRDVRSDSLPSQPDGLERTDLMFRNLAGAWKVVASASRRADGLQLDFATWDSVSQTDGHWAAQSVSRKGVRSEPSNVVWAPLRTHSWYGDDQTHPNGFPSDASTIEPCRASCSSVDAALFPAGDRDYWSFEVLAGEALDVVFVPPPSAYNEVSPTLELYDWKERLVARSEGTFELEYVVPPRKGNHARLRYLLLVKDGLTTPWGEPVTRLLNPPWYNIRVEARRSASMEPLPTALTVTQGHGTVLFRYDPQSSDREARGWIQIFDVHGRLIRSLKEGERSETIRSVVWDMKAETGSPVRSGVYFARLQLGSLRETRRITVLR